MSFGLFWSGVALGFYTYVVFPILVFLRAAARRHPYKTGEGVPTITVIIAAHNEEAVLAAKLDNLLGLDYEPGRLQIIVVSDGSDDSTNAIADAYAGRGVLLLALPRVGKQTALNAAMDVATGDILVFSDANSMYAPHALQALVGPFADPDVGGVAGDQRYLSTVGAGVTGAGEARYWDFDRMLKRSQSAAGNVTSATGAIYAVRRPLAQHIPAGIMDDFYISTGVVAAGYRLVFAPEAVAYEPVASSGTREYRRKVRNTMLGLTAVAARAELLDPRRHGFYAVQLLSHKVLRRVMAVPLVVIAVSTPALWRRGVVYKIAALGQAFLYGSGMLGLARPCMRGPYARLVKLPAYFCLVNAAVLQALWNLLRGRRIHRWEPERELLPAHVANSS